MSVGMPRKTMTIHKIFTPSRIVTAVAPFALAFVLLLSATGILEAQTVDA